MGELDDSFTQLLGRQPTDKDKQDLYRVRDALKLKATDSVWVLLMALQHYLTLYEQIPKSIAAAAREVANAVRATAEAETKAAAAEAKRALMEAVRQAAVKSASKAAGARFLQWLSIAVVGVFGGVLLLGWSAFSRGEEKGKAIGENMSTRTCGALVAASSWANTPDGQLAFAMAKAGSLGEVARCSGRGMAARDGWCTVQSERGKLLARWPMPQVEAKPRGANP